MTPPSRHIARSLATPTTAGGTRLARPAQAGSKWVGGVAHIHHRIKASVAISPKAIETVEAFLPYLPSQGRSPFAGKWIRFSLSPIDTGWELFAKVADVFLQLSGSFGENGPNFAFHLGAFFQVVMNHGGITAVDYREEPCILALPVGNSVDVHGYIWKVDRAGQTQVLLRDWSPLVHTMLSCDIYCEHTLFILHA